MSLDNLIKDNILTKDKNLFLNLCKDKKLVAEGKKGSYSICGDGEHGMKYFKGVDTSVKQIDDNNIFYADAINEIVMLFIFREVSYFMKAGAIKPFAYLDDNEKDLYIYTKAYTGDLDNYVEKEIKTKTKDIQNTNIQFVLESLFKLCQKMSSDENFSFVHGDLKAKNVFYLYDNNSNKLKFYIGDLGTARVLHKNGLLIHSIRGKLNFNNQINLNDSSTFDKENQYIRLPTKMWVNLTNTLGFGATIETLRQGRKFPDEKVKYLEFIVLMASFTLTLAHYNCSLNVVYAFWRQIIHKNDFSHFVNSLNIYKGNNKEYPRLPRAWELVRDVYIDISFENIQQAINMCNKNNNFCEDIDFNDILFKSTSMGTKFKYNLKKININFLLNFKILCIFFVLCCCIALVFGMYKTTHCPSKNYSKLQSSEMTQKLFDAIIAMTDQ